MNKAYAGPNETLLEHLIEVNKLSMKLLKKLRIRDNLLEQSLNIASLLHDIGKALRMYQDNVNSVKEGKFPGHEILSAIISLEIMNYINGLENNVKGIVVYSILSHHQAMRQLKERIANLARILTLSENEVYLKETLINIGKALSIPPVRINVVYNVILNKLANVSRIKRQKIRQRIKEFVRLLHPGFQLIDRHLSESEFLKARWCCGILMIVDTYVAMNKRGGGAESSYRRMVFDFINRFCKNSEYFYE